MEITLEKIELVKDRTGVTYAEAKKALEDADGSVVDAIIAIEETINSGSKGRGFGEKGEALFASLKKLIKKGNVAKIQVKREGEIVLNVPVNAGLIGLCIAPLASVVAIVAAFGFRCLIEVVKTDGTIIDVSDTVSDKVSKAAEYSSDKFEAFKGKAGEYYDKAKETDFYDKAKDTAQDLKGKAGEYYDKAKDKAEDSELYDKAKGKAKDIKEKAGELYEKAGEKAEELKEKVSVDTEQFDMSDVEKEDEDVNVEVEIEEEKDEK